MRLYSGKTATIAEEIIRTLGGEGAIELDNSEEAQLDVEAVLKEYLRLERAVMDEAKERMEQRGLEYGQLGKMRAQVAKEKGAPPQDEVLPYLVSQLLPMLFHSQHIAEIFVDDTALRKAITAVLRKHMEADSDLDRQVRNRIKNLTEGTSDFDIEYQKTLASLKRQRGFTES